MRYVKIKVFAVSLLLLCFMTAGAVLIWQETKPLNNTSAQQSFTASLYENPFGAEHLDAPKPQENKADPQPTHASFILWMLGMPLALMGGLAVGLTLRSQQHPKNSSRRQQVQYMGIHPPPVDEFPDTVSKKLTGAKQQDSSIPQAVKRSSLVRHCQLRFRPITASTRREYQAR